MKYQKGCKMKKILIVYCSLGGNTEAAAFAIKKGIKSNEDVEVVIKKGFQADIDDLLSADGIIFGSGDYFGYMGGVLKDFFDRTFYPSRGKVEGKPYFAFLTHGGGGKGIESIENIAQTFNFKKVMDSIVIKGKPDKNMEEKLFDAGRKFCEIIKK